MTQQGSIAVFECFFRPSCRMSASSLSSLTESNSYAGPPGERTIPDMATPARMSVQCFHLLRFRRARLTSSLLFQTLLLSTFSRSLPTFSTRLFASWCNNISFFVFVLISTREKFFSSFLLQRVQRVCILVRLLFCVFLLRLRLRGSAYRSFHLEHGRERERKIYFWR